MNRIDRLRKKIKENPAVAFAMLDMMNQAYLRETVIEICNDDNLSPVEKADRVLVYLDIPMDKIMEELEIVELRNANKRYQDNWIKQEDNQ